MRRAERLMQIIQIFRRHSTKRAAPITAAQLASELEINIRTVYRDIQSLIGNGVPIRGEAGVGYVMEDGFDLPPMMFNTDELEALMLGARLVATQGDEMLARSALDAVAKIAEVVPLELRPVLLNVPLYAPEFGQSAVDIVDTGDIRVALRENRKIKIDYSDAHNALSQRTLWPIALAYHNGVRLLVGWCELRSDFRHFRVDRMSHLELLAEAIPERHDVLFHRWWRIESHAHGDYMSVRG
jgi:predicted DNA-binding transcriptional regulator YafY